MQVASAAEEAELASLNNELREGVLRGKGRGINNKWPVHYLLRGPVPWRSRPDWRFPAISATRSSLTMLGNESYHVSSCRFSSEHTLRRDASGNGGGGEAAEEGAFSKWPV